MVIIGRNPRNSDILKTRRKCVHNEYQHTEAHMSLENDTKGGDRKDMTLGGTEGYFLTLDNADKRSEK